MMPADTRDDLRAEITTQGEPMEWAGRTARMANATAPICEKCGGSQAFVGMLVPAEDLASAVSLNGVVMNSARVVGPAVAGILIVTVGTTPCFAVNAVSYAAVIVGTHLTNFMNLVIEYDAVHESEHVLYLVVGYLYFLPLVGKEPIKWKMSYPLRLFLLFLAMPVDAFTGVVLGSYQTYPFLPMEPRNWGPTPLNDIHQGGAVMWIGGAAIMFAVIMVTFFSWSREPRSSAAMGWFETVRRATMADRMNEVAPAAPATAGLAADASGQGRRPPDVDDDDDQLAAYNAYLTRINGPVSHNSKATE